MIVVPILYINSTLTSQETHYVSYTKRNRLMLLKETVAVYCGNNTEHKLRSVDSIPSFNMLEQVVHIVTARI
jgi:hypothetical protein